MIDLVMGKKSFLGLSWWGDGTRQGILEYAIVETGDAVSLNKYLMQWDDLCDVGVTPVMDDEGAFKSLES